MKKLAIILSLLSSLGINAQTTNSFPDSGNVGIGTTIPTSKLHVNGSIGVGLMNGLNTEGLKIDYVDGGSGKTTFKNNRWGGDIYFKRNSSLGERTQFLFGGASEHYMNIYNDNNEVKVRFKSGGDSYINGGNVGIGTTSPSEKLQIENGVVKVRSNNNSNRFIWSRTDNTMTAGIAGDGGRKMFFLADNLTRMTVDGNTGNVGIGTVTPNSKLEINGDVTIGNSNRVGSYANIIGAGSNQSFGLQLGSANNPDGKASILSHTTTGGIYFSVQESQAMFLDSSGNLGIGNTNTHGFKLGVKGKIAAEEVKVQVYPWSDFVFAKEYNLPTLKEVEQHINKNGHLKDIPSAEEVNKNGIFLGEMNAKLLQKIEELTLYTIEQEKKIESQNSKIDKLEKENKELQSLSKRLAEIEKLLNK